MVQITGENGVITVERKVYFNRGEHEYQNICVSAQCEGTATPDEVKQITEIVEKASKEIKKIVEKW